MKETNIIGTVVMIVVVISLLALVLVPTIQNNKETEEGTQDSDRIDYYATNVVGGETYTLSDTSLVYNGTVLGTEAVTFGSDAFKVVFYNGGLNLFDAVNNLNGIPITKLVINEDKTYTWTADDVDTTSTNTLSTFIGPADEGDYVYVLFGTSYDMKVNANQTVYVLTNASYSDGDTTIANYQNIALYSGTVTDLQPVIAKIRDSDEWVDASGTFTMTSAAYNDEVGYYDITMTTDEATLNDYESTSDQKFLFVPYEYVYYKDSAYNGLMSVIPVMIVVALIVSAVGLVIRK